MELCPLFQKSLPKPKLLRLLSMFYLEIVCFAFILRSMSYFELIYVCGMS